MARRDDYRTRRVEFRESSVRGCRGREIESDAARLILVRRELPYRRLIRRGDGRSGVPAPFRWSVDWASDPGRIGKSNAQAPCAGANPPRLVPAGTRARGAVRLLDPFGDNPDTVVSATDPVHMASYDIIRYIDSIARDKDIDKEGLFLSIESAVSAALCKKYGLDDLELKLDRNTGEWLCNYEVSMEEQGRILAQAVKQAIISRVREAERDVLYDEYEQRIGEIISGTVQRFEGDTVIVNIGRNMEGILPRAEKVRTENYNVGDRIRALVLEVKKVGPRVKVILSRGHRDLVRALFELEVPEIADGVIMIRRIEREPGYRTKLAVHSSDPKVDCVGACVGVRGTRIKSIIDELNGERIDIIRWNEDLEVLITHALKPAEISHIELSYSTKKALVLVEEEQLSLAIGRKGQNVRLASKLAGWDIDIMTRAELEKTVEDEERAAAEGTPEGTAEGEAKGTDPAASTEGSAGGDPAQAATDGADGGVTAPATDPEGALPPSEPQGADGGQPDGQGQVEADGIRPGTDG